jgi:hypothetical protein
MSDAMMMRRWRERHEKERERRRGRDVGESLSFDQNPLSIASIGGTPTDRKLHSFTTSSTSARRELFMTVEIVSC